MKSESKTFIGFHKNWVEKIGLLFALLFEVENISLK